MAQKARCMAWINRLRKSRDFAGYRGRVATGPRIPAVVLIGTVLVGALAGCSPGTLFVTDPYADALVQYSVEERREIRTLLDDAPQPDQYLALEPEENPATVLQDRLNPQPPDLVFVTAYLEDTAAAVAPAFSDTRFVILGSGTGAIDAVSSEEISQPRAATSAQEASGSNLIPVRFDRSAAMARAGELTAEHAMDGDPALEVMLFALVDTAERRREVDAFVRGFRERVSAAQGAVALEVRRFEDVPSRDAVRSAFREASSRYGIFAVFLGTGSPYAVEQAIGTGKLFGSENLGLFEPLQERMLFTVDTRLSDALRAYLRTAREAAAPWDASEVVATARLVLGPAAMEEEITEEGANRVNNETE